MTELPKNVEAELTALADGSLAAGHREHALERVRGSRELQAALAEQRRVVELAAAAEVKAPASLHGQIEAMLTPARRAGQRGHNARGQAMRRLGFLAAAATVALIAAVAIGLIGGPTRPGAARLGVQQAAALTLSPATGPAPAESSRHRSQLSVAVSGVSFPYWKERFGWRSSGTRSDRIAGRSVRTVFYTNAQGRRVGYAIASGRAPATQGGTVVSRWGVSYRLLSHDGATVVVWERAGHLCVMSGRGVSAQTLLSLASWGGEKPAERST